VLGREQLDVEATAGEAAEREDGLDGSDPRAGDEDAVGHGRSVDRAASRHIRDAPPTDAGKLRAPMPS
jgi:hypothetical protein